MNWKEVYDKKSLGAVDTVARRISNVSAKQRADYISRVQSECKLISKIVKAGYYVIIKNGRTKSIHVKDYNGKLKYQPSFKDHESFIKAKAMAGPVWIVDIKGALIYDAQAIIDKRLLTA